MVRAVEQVAMLLEPYGLADPVMLDKDAASGKAPVSLSVDPWDTEAMSCPLQKKTIHHWKNLLLCSWALSI